MDYGDEILSTLSDFKIYEFGPYNSVKNFQIQINEVESEERWMGLNLLPPR